ncbi:GGDEF domain-containing protein [Actimicrobium sp. CCI2.3]|uniref:GGDEF domain-containing protein n=1 Tax=Actimicrobium sp. CCI2.3 TaxID=3048616 RepID=UPI002AB44F5F|nr:GGDEF domain-containing protein [Actimicrobium sp. CCI2.3]MDY7574459.1 GGDEF domain-containing protein [Actimicrobium sp. CCI2.3]MEB0022463.1 GGDEF domain-containing protein [Actimicrobium sp. CCI2.3]
MTLLFAPSLDPATLVFAIAMFCFLISALAFGMTASTVRRMGMTEWGCAIAMTGAGILLRFGCDEDSCQISVLAANLLVVSAAASVLLAYTRLFDIGYSLRTVGLIWAVGMVSVLSTALFDLPVPVSHLAPALSVAILLGLAAALIGYQCLAGLPCASSLANAIMMFAISAAFALHASLALPGEDAQEQAASLPSIAILVTSTLAIAIASWGFMAMAYERQRRDAFDKIRRDGLTGLYSQSAFFDLASRIDGSKKRVPYAVVMVDLDYFKVINDTYGHAAGDRVLEQAARLITRSVRLSDIAARYGGEEFCILLRDCGEAEAARFAQRLVKESGQLAVRLQDERLASFTISVGYACRFVDCVSDGPAETVRAALERADQALYAAKRAGRNRALPALAEMASI